MDPIVFFGGPYDGGTDSGVAPDVGEVTIAVPRCCLTDPPTAAVYRRDPDHPRRFNYLRHAT